MASTRSVPPRGGAYPRRLRAALAGVAFAAIGSSVRLPAQSAPLMTLVKAGRLLDPRTGSVLSPAAVLIDSGRIKEVGAPSRVQADAPAGVRTIDLGRATL